MDTNTQFIFFFFLSGVFNSGELCVCIAARASLIGAESALCHCPGLPLEGSENAIAH